MPKDLTPALCKVRSPFSQEYCTSWFYVEPHSLHIYVSPSQIGRTGVIRISRKQLEAALKAMDEYAKAAVLRMK